MKFSVLLPTRNRLDLLARAIETVRRQDYDDWEIIVSDNFSDEDVAGYIQTLSDQRIKFFRTDRFVPVTDNWNNALEKCDGDYVIMLGDDDGLMKGYFSRMVSLLREFERPDFIYTNAFLYAYPNVMPGEPEGFLKTYSRRELFVSAEGPYWLARQKALELVKDSLDFRVSFDYNMQFSLVSRRLIEEMQKYGPFYQSPYPDYYASNAMLLAARRILVVPLPMVAIGISPKSFGYYYFNDNEQGGKTFLKNIPTDSMANRLRKTILPGSDMNTSWLISMETVFQNFEAQFNVPVNYRRYRYIQICSVFAANLLGVKSAKEIYRQLLPKLNIYELIVFAIPFWAIKILPEGRPKRWFAHKAFMSTRAHPKLYLPKVIGNFQTMLEVFENVSPDSYLEATE